MKKLLKRVITYILILILSVICVKPMNVSAHGGFFTTDSFTFDGTWTDSNDVPHNAYTMQDDSALSSGFKYYMKVADGVAICCDGGQVITNILNYKLGLTMSASTIASFIGTYIADNQFTGKDPNFYNLYPPVLKGSSMVGIALNSLTGCRMAYSSGDDSIEIPSGLSNDVYNFYINVFQVDNPELPDFINIPSFPKTEFHGVSDVKYLPTYEWVLNSSTEVYFGLCDRLSFHDTVFAYTQAGSANQCGIANSIADYRFILKTGYENGFNNCCNTFNLTPQNNTISASDFYASTGVNLIFNMYDSNLTKITFSQNNQNGTTVKAVGFDATGEGTPPFWNADANLSNLTDLSMYTDQYRKFSFYSNTEPYLTIYRNSQVIQQIQNNTYNQNTYSSETTNNYNTSNDNSYTTNVQNINNSSSNNTQIYNETKTTTNENITNNDYSYDYSSQVTQNTTIINNYYGDNGAPDNGGGGGDDNGGDDDDDDDDTIWKALLKAIGDFLKKIGELIATVLTGIISILTSVLDAIASITTSFSTITDFLGAVFGFLPSELVAVITLGVTLGILISLIKMFGK